ncbi:M48 family metalloprotease [Thalassoroseus pseudoceratinae]|uniref:M48 family metalloprotease n=1 Tax=Thalassoroseus pseudoceratinae TaxID=2713176 RepID=UPI0014220F6B|nr:M48 family metalloprotease [Thalassoroseus pseudoceratinae]
MRTVLLMALIGLVVTPSAWSATPIFMAYSNEQRAEIDLQINAGQPNESGAKPFYGGLAGWALVKTPFPLEKQFEEASRQHKLILKRSSVVPTPLMAQATLERLADELPSTWADHDYALIVVDRPGWHAWTVGGRWLYISQDYLSALTIEPEAAESRLAFVLARELGHMVRGHCRRGYKLFALQKQAESKIKVSVDRVALARSAQAAVKMAGGLLEFVYSAQQIRQADLFALHLLRNSGYDCEAGLDVVRTWVAIAEDKESDLAANALPTTPPPTERLRHLRHEWDGVYEDTQYGLFRYNARKETWKPLTPKSLPAGSRPIVLVHGMETRLETWNAVLAKVASDPNLQNRPILGLHYPGDGSLTRAAHALRRLTREVEIHIGRADFLCHSAGGLVFRYYAEVLEGPYRNALLVATPHQGSNLAKLRPLLEVAQFARDLRLGYSEALRRTILDGEDQISFDLEPESLFLRYLTEQGGDHTRYTVVRGRVLGPLASFAVSTAADQMRTRIIRTLTKSNTDNPRQSQRNATIEQLTLPPEILDGDLLVATQSAILAGVREDVTLKFSHDDLIHKPEAVEILVELLNGG